MVRRIKPGDIFYLFEESGKKRFFQLITVDKTLLNSDLIRVFKRKYYEEDMPSSAELVLEEVDFYVHTYIKWGLKAKMWRYYANNSIVGSLDIPFRSTADGPHRQKELVISINWNVWYPNQPIKFVGLLPKEYYSAEIGSVYFPGLVEERINNGYDLRKSAIAFVDDMFVYLPRESLMTNAAEEDDSIVIKIDSSVEGKKKIITLFGSMLCLKSNEDNWDDFFGNLCELSNTPISSIRIIHDDLPSLEENDMSIYINILQHVVVTWYNKENNSYSYPRLHKVQVFFPNDLRDIVHKYLTHPLDPWKKIEDPEQFKSQYYPG